MFPARVLFSRNNFEKQSTKFSYAVSLVCCTIEVPASNVAEFALFLLDSSATAAVHWAVYSLHHWQGLAYLVLSMAFANGFLLHPLLGFWLMQHLCTDAKQPTVGYSGSAMWNWLTFNEMLQ